MNPFNFARIPKTIFKPGSIREINEISLVKDAKNILLVTGATSFRNSEQFKTLISAIQFNGGNLYETIVANEPSPELVDNEVNINKSKSIDLVIAVGGGSVLDAGKAISAMLTQNKSVTAYLEGVGDGSVHNGEKIPFIAVPTTSGTGSEATKNAVLSRVGEGGFKKSLRHDNFVPEIALLDPELTLTCPSSISAASGLDALTQLLGSYVSTKASPMTDAFALSGLSYIKECLVPVCTTEQDNVNKRAGMSYAAYLSGITLANAGLGIVHGFASSVGGYFDIPHGVVCGTLLAESVKLNIELLKEDGKVNNPYLRKYAKAGSILTECNEKDINDSCHKLVEILFRWTEELAMPKLSHYGMKEKDLNRIVDITGRKNNPIELSNTHKKTILMKRL